MAKTNRGAVALRRVMARKKLSQGDVRRAIKAPAGVVTRWLSGERRPGARNAVLLQEHFGIKVSLWWDEEEGEDDESEAA